MKLGRLKEVNIREIWPHEQNDFSKWLAEEENLKLLSDALGITLVNAEREAAVGAYRCDLVATDDDRGLTVVIENQLETTNHDHLGKIITYASGLNAEVVVWIVKEAREEHRSAIEWLNEKTNENVSFFLLEIHAYCIGDSKVAPKFEVIERPNDFANMVKSTASKEGTRAQVERLTFWTEFNEKIKAAGKPFNIGKADIRHWHNVALGTSEAHIGIALIDRANRISVDIYIPSNKDLFDSLCDRAEEIEVQLGFSMEWLRLDDGKASRIRSYIDGLNYDDHSNYPELMDQVIERVVHMRKVFQQYIK